MRFTVETWDSDYGAPTDPDLDDASENVDVSVEMRAEDWRPILPETPVKRRKLPYQDPFGF